MGDQVIALEHETNGVVAVGVPVAVGVLLGGDAVDDQVTAIIAVKAANDVEQCGFAGAAGAQDGDKLIVTEVQADIVEGDLFQIACFVFLPFWATARSRMRVSGPANRAARRSAGRAPTEK